MLQRCLLFRAAAKRPETRHHENVMALPLDVVLRRMQSSSVTNPARSLEAHFRAKEVAGNGSGSGATGLATSPSASTVDIRAALSERLLATLGGEESKPHEDDAWPSPSSSPPPSASPLSAAFHKRASPGKPDLSLDQVSLVLANAIRHGLSEPLVRASFLALSDIMDDRNRGGTGPASGLFFAGSDREVLKAEALSRVLEACVSASSAYPSGEKRGGLHGLSTDMWASLAGWLAERWDALAGSPSTACLMLQFYAAAIECVGGCAASSVSSRMSLTSLQTDPTLLREHCYKQCGRALESVLAEYSSSSPAGERSGSCGGRASSASQASVKVLSRPTELVRLSEAVFRLRAYEGQVRAATRSASGGPPPSSAVAAAESSSSLAWRRWWGSGRRRREQKSAALSAPMLSLSSQVGVVVAEHAIPMRRHRLSRVDGGSCSSSGLGGTPVMPIAQAAKIFSAVAESAPIGATADLSLHLTEVLRRRREDGGLMTDADAVAGVLAIGEACVRRSDGTLTALAEVLRCLQSSAFPLAQCAFNERERGPCEFHGTRSPSYTLWPRACEFVESVPLSLRSTVDQTLLTFANAFLSQAPQPSPQGRPVGDARRRHGRYGALVLAWQLTHGSGSDGRAVSGEVARAVVERVWQLTEAFPFADAATPGERRVELRAVVRALSVVVACGSSSSQNTTSSWPRAHVHSVRNLLQQLSFLLAHGAVKSDEGNAAMAAQAPKVALEVLTVAERTMLRQVVRAVRSQTVALTQPTAAAAAAAQRSANGAESSQRHRPSLLSPAAGVAAAPPWEEGGAKAAARVDTDTRARRRETSSPPATHRQPEPTPVGGVSVEPPHAAAPVIDTPEDSYQLQKELAQLSHELHKRYAVK